MVATRGGDDGAMIELLGDFFGDPSRWSGEFGIPNRTWEHVYISALATTLGAAVALPIGFFIGHTRRGEFAAVSIGNIGRALPSFGVLALVFPFTFGLPGSLGFWPTLIALILLAIPPILTNTYVGIKNVDRDTVEAARGMGMTGGEIVRRLEIPLAAPLIVAGLRTGAVAVVATATLGAVLPFGGLGRFLIDGFATGDNAQILGGAVLVALLAIATEALFSLVERAVAPRTRTSGAEERGAALGAPLPPAA